MDVKGVNKNNWRKTLINAYSEPCGDPHLPLVGSLHSLNWVAEYAKPPCFSRNPATESR